MGKKEKDKELDFIKKSAKKAAKAGVKIVKVKVD